ncbi:sulfatase [Streptomyces sp. NPDC060065]|uniref:sulfatase n=1 Tax=Streptomyces sp. NPDC060065 TaxID=3347050 RepID=UPI0036977155
MSSHSSSRQLPKTSEPTDETQASPDEALTPEEGLTPEKGLTPEAAGETPADNAPETAAQTTDEPTPEVAPGPDRRGWRIWRGWRDRYPVAAKAVSWTVNTLAAALVLFTLLMSNNAAGVTPIAFVRIPVEAIFGAALLIVLPRRPRVVVASLLGLVVGVQLILNVLDMGFKEYLGRDFNLVLDWTLFDDAHTYLQDTIGAKGTLGLVVAIIVLVLVVLVAMVLAVVRLGNVLARHTTTATRTTLVFATAWVACAALGVQFTADMPVAAERSANLAHIRVKAVQSTLRDEAEFAKVAKKDAFANTPPDQLLTDLRGKDMMITFIESYGRSAIEDPLISPGVNATLTTENEKLRKAGFAAESGWLTSATYGGSSWLGHSTFLSGLWINNQQRYRTITNGDHMTLTSAFQKTDAWRTVGIMPGVQKTWPEAKFFGLDNVYDSRELGYKGPKFSWSTMPDQYALAAFERLEHGKKQDKPLMSEIILTSSHQPWGPIPKMVPQDQLGDGSIFEAIEKEGTDPSELLTNSTRSKEEYGKSIQYSVTSLIDYLVKYGNDNTVLIFLGDHQPIARVSGNNASRDVPVSIVAKDPKVLDKIADWGWTDGLQPNKSTPVWKMSDFRDRFLTAYGSTPTP